ncbi:hypothetical protein [Pseudomonas putida]|uniref:Uncharacterized protein n=1 Tax=Pseudomonas putida TaxID=303 RepID=A0A1X1A3Y4_PSEPU|nr:hypothetical protein [Pseudomonas putida]ORL66644.1 hypothetical protein B7H17_05025 [Pseudomonas putida]
MTDLICRKTMQRCQTPGMCRPHGGCRPDQGFESGHMDLGKFVDWVWSLKAERDQLKAENEDYKSGQERYEQIIEDLKAENEALRKIISESSAACGAAVSVECSLEFMAMLPSEIGTVLTALRKDAERWKFFKELSCQIQAFPHAWGQMTPEKMDFMCDEAMAKEAGHG